MDASNIKLESILQRASELRIAVVGDLITDRYIDGVIERISPEAPVPVLKITGTRENPGGAGNVVENLKGLGCQVSAFYGKHVPIKTRVMCGTHHIIRMDDEDDPIWMQIDEFDMGLIYGIEKKKFDCLVISDYGKGCISKEIASDIITSCNQVGIPVVVDSKSQLEYFKGATVVKCNEKEWEHQKYFGSTNSWILENNFHAVVVTRGHLGITLDDVVGNHLITRTHSIDVCDPCGAGDTVTAMLAIGVVLKHDFSGFFEAVELANIAASEVCQHPGVYPINKEALIKRFNEVMK